MFCMRRVCFGFGLSGGEGNVYKECFLGVGVMLVGGYFESLGILSYFKSPVSSQEHTGFIFSNFGGVYEKSNSVY